MFEGDGFHAHVYRVGDPAWSRVVVTEHLHTWMGEHRRACPNARPVDVEVGGGDWVAVDTLADAWAYLAGAGHAVLGEVPVVECLTR